MTAYVRIGGQYSNGLTLGEVRALVTEADSLGLPDTAQLHATHTSSIGRIYETSMEAPMSEVDPLKKKT